ncbi:MAG: hypothetical protein VX278_19190 [Myxococcota bacterium]|nr:hypothetical protein [Myxococcota bacterium]
MNSTLKKDCVWNIKEFAKIAGCTDLKPAYLWMERWLEQGITPFDGPLQFDIVPPTTRSRRRWGINLFGHDAPNMVFAIAQQWSQQFCRPPVWKKLHEWNQLPLTWNGGIIWNNDQWYLKLYLTGDSQCFPSPFQSRNDILALGFDVHPEGIRRLRSYHIYRPTDLQSWPMLTSIPKSPCISHFLTTIARNNETIEKRSFNNILSPQADITAVEELAHHLDYQDFPREYAFWSKRLRLQQMDLSTIALEWDMYRDGHTEWDFLFSFRERHPKT